MNASLFGSTPSINLAFAGKFSFQSGCGHRSMRLLPFTLHSSCQRFQTLLFSVTCRHMVNHLPLLHYAEWWGPAALLPVFPSSAIAMGTLGGVHSLIHLHTSCRNFCYISHHAGWRNQHLVILGALSSILGQ